MFLAQLNMMRLLLGMVLCLTGCGGGEFGDPSGSLNAEDDTDQQQEAQPAAYELKINFQPQTLPAPVGYQKDVGYLHGHDGLTFGWSQDISSWSPKDRNSSESADERYDTLLFMNGRSWEVDLENGRYEVRIVAGDPRSTDLQMQIDIEGTEGSPITVIDGTAPTTSEQRWIDSVITVDVTDGKLKLMDIADNNHARLCFVEITALE